MTAPMESKILMASRCQRRALCHIRSRHCAGAVLRSKLHSVSLKCCFQKLDWSHPFRLFHSTWKARCITTTHGEQQLPSIALLFDADGQGIDSIKRSVELLRSYGHLVKIILFAEPRRLENTAWRHFVTEHGLEFYSVERKGRGALDPNDMAVASVAESLAAKSSVQCIAFAVKDADYIPVVQRAMARGKHCIVILPSSHIGLVELFERTSATVLRRDSANAQPSSMAKLKAVLHGDGTGSMKELTGQLPIIPSHDVDFMKRKLKELGALADDRDPVVPAVARFWYANELGCLPVFPLALSFSDAIKVLSNAPTKPWSRSQDQLAFVLPRSTLTKSKQALRRYGTELCGAIASGGGPFMLRESQQLPEDILERMQYLDSSMNTSVEEALEVFWSIGYNMRALRKLGMQITSEDSTQDKLEKLKQVSTSTSFDGFFQVPLRDGRVRHILIAKGHLQDDQAPKVEVAEGMKRFLDHQGIPAMRTYNALVWQCTSLFTGNDPSRRC